MISEAVGVLSLEPAAMSAPHGDTSQHQPRAYWRTQWTVRKADHLEQLQIPLKYSPISWFHDLLHGQAHEKYSCTELGRREGC